MWGYREYSTRSRCLRDKGKRVNEKRKKAYLKRHVRNSALKEVCNKLKDIGG
jgi:hypothetical protein